MLLSSRNRKPIIDCKRCGLFEYRKYIVVGRGYLPCDIMLLGEAPGMTENLTGLAFNGPAGDVLDLMLKESGLDSYKLFFTNTVLCRPCESHDAENRKPRAEEVLACYSNVLTIVETAKPKHVILLGEVAKAYYKKEFPDANTLYHPSFILRTGSKASPYYLATIRAMEQIKYKVQNMIDAELYPGEEI